MRRKSNIFKGFWVILLFLLVEEETLPFSNGSHSVGS